MFIVLEGIDGTGKTTIAQKLADELKLSGYNVLITEEPTKTWIGEGVRRAIEEEKNGFTQALLFFADRADHIENLKKKKENIIISDRYVYSTYAYQGAQLEKIMGLEKAIKWFEKVYEPFSYDPDMVILITVEPEEGLKRIYGRDRKEKFERHEFLRRVQEIYLLLAKKYGFVVIDGNRNLDDVFEEVKNVVFEKIKDIKKLK